VDVVPYQLTNRSNRSLVKVSAVPLSAALSQEIADDAVVCADIQCTLAGQFAEPGEDLPELGLLQY
jgi:hypothetical protein